MQIKILVIVVVVVVVDLTMFITEGLFEACLTVK